MYKIQRHFQIFIIHNNTLTLWVKPNYTIKELKYIIESKIDVPVDLQNLRTTNCDCQFRR